MSDYDMDFYEEHDDHDLAMREDVICDAECRGANGCGGHAVCSGCGKVMCGCEIGEDGLCPSCAEDQEAHTCQECGNYDPDVELVDGVCPDCQAEIDRENAIQVAARNIRTVCVAVGLVILAGCARAGGIDYERLLDAVEMVESDRGATSANLYQVRQIWLDDCRRIGIFASNAPMSKIVRDRRLVRELIRGYWAYYGLRYRRLTGQEASAEVLARIHNGGPDGWRKQATRSYWVRVSKFYK